MGSKGRTGQRTVRVDVAEWQEACEIAANGDESINEVVRAALRDYVNGDWTPQDNAPRGTLVPVPR